MLGKAGKSLKNLFTKRVEEATGFDNQLQMEGDEEEEKSMVI